MQESGFAISDPQGHFVIRGGQLWQAQPRKTSWQANLQDRCLTMSFRPEDTYEEVIESLRQTIREVSPVLSFRLWVSSQLTPLVLVLPAIILIFFIGTLGAYGNLINELISLDGHAPTNLFGISKYELFFIQTTFYIVIAYAFPLFIQGDYNASISRFRQLTDNESVMRGRIERALRLMQKRHYLDRVEIWNPSLNSPVNSWVTDVLLPGILDSGIPLTLHVKVEEQFVARSLLERLSGKPQNWQDLGDDIDFEARSAIPLEYLEEWEREMWQVFAAASTINMPDHCLASAGEDLPEGALSGVVSLSLAQHIVDHFQNRLFSSSLAEQNASVNLFASRCLHDYGLLHPLHEHEQGMYKASPGLLQPGMGRLREERSYVFPYLQRNAGAIAEDVKDIAGRVVLAGTQTENSLYNENKRRVIEAFIDGVLRGEHFKVLRYYWDKLIREEGQDEAVVPEVELFRLIPTPLLQELVMAFRRAGMYDKTGLCFRFLQAIYPIASRIGEAVVLSEQGKYEESVEVFLQVDAEWMGDLTEKERNRPVVASKSDRLSLNLYMCVVIVMNQLRPYKALAEKSLALIGDLLAQMKDGERDNQQLTRYYNVLASYHEWNKDYSQAVETYEKGLSIPGVDRALVSSLMVNKGIAYRLLGKTSVSTEEKLHFLKLGVETNGEGVQVKEVIGNEDQLPIALHNLAETCIELAHHLPSEKALPYYRAAWTHSSKGISINQRIRSTKKLGQLYTERFLAWKGLGAPAQEADTTRTALVSWLRENASKEGYDIDVVKDLLTRIGGFEGSSLKEAADWVESGN